MKRVKVRIRPNKINPNMIYTILFSLAILVILICSFALFNFQNDKKLKVEEDADILTGPNAAYPKIYNVQKGDTFNIISKEGKWLEVVSPDEKKKGWIAGWHTNLDIKEDVNPNSEPLKNKVVILDPGHGGGDQGASSSQSGKQTLEKDITLKTSLELKKKLEDEGAKVKMTRSDDTYVKLKDRQDEGDVFISIHNDALESKKANGATVYWYKEQQERLAESLNSAIQEKALLSNRGTREENFQVLRQTDLPAVLLELGYISNPTDEAMMKDKNYRAIVESGIVEGLKEYFLS
ncbi:N-acetylmuramoyl-L-alanine amidase [Staphylococcus sp. 11261D007BR]